MIRRSIVLLSFSVLYLAWPATLFARDVLYLELSDSATFGTALAASGVDHTTVTDPAVFDSALNNGVWDLVVVESSCCFINPGPLTDYVNNGGRAFLSYWDLDAEASLAVAFDVQVVSSLDTSATINRWVAGSALWNYPNELTSLPADSSLWTDNGDRLQPTGAGYAVGGFTPASVANEAAVVIGNEGRTIVVGQEFDGIADSAAVAFAENCLDFLLGPQVLVHSDNGPAQAIDALVADGISYSVIGGGAAFDLALDRVHWDLVIVESSLASLSSGELVNYLNAGGQAIVSYWNLDQDPDLQAALGVVGTTELDVPMPIFAWPDESPFAETLWSIPNPLSEIAAGPNVALDNGDLLTAADDAYAVGGFTALPTTGQAAVVVGRGGNTICIGHDMLGLEPISRNQFLHNCVRFMLEPSSDVLIYETSIRTVPEDALDRTGQRYRVVSTVERFRDELAVGRDWDLVVVDAPNFAVPSEQLIRYINDGGRLLLSYWSLDGDPALQAALGVTTNMDLLTPSPITAWPTDTPIWTEPNLLTGLPIDGTDPWSDNGDWLTVDSGVALGGFAATPTPDAAGVAATRGGRVIVVGHEFDSLMEETIVDGVENFVHWLNPSPANDDCFDALPIAVGETIASNLANATNDGTATCGSSSSNPDVWYQFTAPGDGEVTISTCGTHDAYGLDDGMDTVLGLFDECGGTEIDCNDDVTGCGGIDMSVNRDSSITTALTVGESVLIRVSHWGPHYPGPFVLNANFDFYAPPNDDCANADGLALGATEGYLSGSTNDGTGSCGASASSPDVWYTFTAPTDGTLRVDTCGTNDLGGVDQGIDPVLTILDSCGGTELVCNDNWSGTPGGACAALDAGLARDAVIDFDLFAGETVKIRLATAAGSDTGPFVLNTAFTLPAPANDDCANAQVVGEGVFLGSLAGATNDGSSSCGASGDPDVWYRYVAVESGTLAVSTCGTHDSGGVDTGVDTLLALYDGCGGSELGCNDNATVCSGTDVGAPGDAAVQVSVAAGDTVSIRVAAADASTATGVLLTVSLAPPTSPLFIRGDVNGDGGFDVSDPVFLLAQLFQGGTPTTCNDAADANDDEVVDVADPVYALAALFIPGADQIPAPTSCGPDPSGTVLDCESASSCP